MLNIVSKYIYRHHLLQHSAKYIVALSGGADSVALLLTLKQLDYNIEAAHCNFHLRGEESDRDEHFCVELCKQNGVKLHRAHFDTLEYASLHKVSVEMAARELRYNWFSRLVADLGAAGICVAHHRDDSVETIILNLVRGTGLRGLTGIQNRTTLNIDNDKPLVVLRPLLCVGRSNIIDFLNDREQDFVTDSTNLDAEEALRNNIRLNIIPRLQEINPSVVQSISKTSQRLNALLPIIEQHISQSVAESKEAEADTYSIATILHQRAPEYTLFDILTPKGFTPQQVEDIHDYLQQQRGRILNGECSGRIFTSNSHQALIDRTRLIIEPVAEEPVKKSYKIPEPGNYTFPTLSLRISITDRPEGSELSELVPKDKNIMVADADLLQFPLTLRNVHQGDIFQPYGMHGRTKLLSDYMTDQKMSLFDKQRQMVLTDSRGIIVWVVGRRTDYRFRLDKYTKRIVTIKF